MAQFFDFLFLRIFKFYKSYNEKGAQSSAAGIVGGFQAFNIMKILMLVSLVFRDKIYFSNKLIIVGIVVLFQITTYIRYILNDGKNLVLIEKKWEEATDQQKKLNRLYASVYMIVSGLGLVALAVYIGSQRW